MGLPTVIPQVFRKLHARFPQLSRKLHATFTQNFTQNFRNALPAGANLPSQLLPALVF
jgi:hypothetical protein